MWGFFVLHIYDILRHMKLLKLILVSVMYFIVMSCNNVQNTESGTNEDSSSEIKAVALIYDSVVLTLSKQILSILKHENYQQLDSFIDGGVRFSPYGYIDTLHDKKLTAEQLVNYLTKNKLERIDWGILDDKNGKPILLTAQEYFKKFVYDVDFLDAPNLSLNKTISSGNSLNNIDSVYGNCTYVEFYFPGFEEKYDGMDWRSLKLVFEKQDNKLFLIGVVHDQWTI